MSDFSMPIRLFYFTLLLNVLLIKVSLSQVEFSSHPDDAAFHTEDIDNFWKAYAVFQADTSKNPFGTEYILKGSKGVKDFLPYRIKNEAHLRAVVMERMEDYERIKNNTLRIKEEEKHCRTIFYTLKDLYPKAKFPPVYFVIGAFNSGGTSSSNGLIIGAEMQSDIANIPSIVAHELIHFQQFS